MPVRKRILIVDDHATLREGLLTQINRETDVPPAEEGEAVDPRRVISLAGRQGRPVLPPFGRSASAPFLQLVQASGRKWVIITDPAGQPCLVMNAPRPLRSALFGGAAFDPDAHWHRPIVVRSHSTPLGEVIGRPKPRPQSPEDDVVDEDFILLWGEEQRAITGSGILGRLLRGIFHREPAHAASKPEPE